MSLARPPATLSCSELFSTWLPDAFARAHAAGAKPPDIVVAMVIDGPPVSRRPSTTALGVVDGGGAWTLRVAGGKLAVENRADPAATLTLRQSVADFRAAVWGEGEQRPLLPADFDVAAALTGELQVPIASLAEAKGTLHLDVPGFAGRTFQVSLTIGGAAEPSASVTADLSTLDQLRTGALQPTDAFFTGKIRVAGDVPWLMQVGLTLASGRM